MNENAVHVRIEYEEALESKKSLLSLEMELLRVVQSIRRYNHFRNKELKSKIKLESKMKSLIIDTRKIEKTLPKVKIPESKKPGKETSEEKQKKKKEEKYDLTIEQELQDIQRKLSSMQG